MLVLLCAPCSCSLSLTHLLTHFLFAGPPKALDDDETEFLENLETVRQDSMFYYSFMLSVLLALHLKHLLVAHQVSVDFQFLIGLF